MHIAELEPYIAGPMTDYIDYNYPAFFAKEESLLARGVRRVFNPARNCGETLEKAIASAKESEGIKVFADFFRPDLRMLSQCNALVMLPEWQRSKRGAPLEYKIARTMELPVFTDHPTKGLIPLYTAVGVSGYARAGKDTIAKALVEEKGFTRLAFADIVRDALYALNPWVHTDEYDSFAQLQFIVDGEGWDRAKAKYPEIRTLQQKMGGDAGRGVIGIDIWVNAAMRKMEDGGRYVFSDMRYPNEAEAVKQLGGQNWRVEREGVGPVNDHESEIALDNHPMDRHLYNYSTIGALRDQALAAAVAL